MGDKIAAAFCGATVTAAVIMLGIKGCTDTPEEIVAKAEEAKQLAAQREADNIPRKFSEGDGCEVWKFNPDGKRWQFFTKCGDAKTSTKTQWQECRSVPSGKSTRTECVTKDNVIDNEGK